MNIYIYNTLKIESGKWISSKRAAPSAVTNFPIHVSFSFVYILKISYQMLKVKICLRTHAVYPKL